MAHRVSNLFIAVTAAALAACAHRTALKSDRSSASTSSSQAGAQAAPSLVDAGEPLLRGASMHAIPELKTIHFAYDSSDLDEEARATLAANAQWLKDHSSAKVEVAGHCDQRGTSAYNLALGQRRAAEVRQYYLRLGVPGGRVATISYGKEKLLCAEEAEECWLKNRRAETLAAFPTVANTR